jgi:glucose-1-phosphate thymidylyltransferase
MKGIILAGGAGTRLHPITLAISKQLMPVYDKPMIYYPLSNLMMAGIKDILIITTPEDQPLFINLLKDGSQWGINIEYAVQENPNGLAEAFIIGEDFIGDDGAALILGDNIFHGAALPKKFQKCSKVKGGKVFAYHVHDPERYGVVEFNGDNKVLSIEEKPKYPKSNYAIPGFYFFDNNVVEYAKNVKPSSRGELEITSILDMYLENETLSVEILDTGTAWLDTGTFNSLMQAANYVNVIEERQGLKIGCIEEVAYKMKFIDKAQLMEIAIPLRKSGYGEYLIQIVEKK